jgi:agarase
MKSLKSLLVLSSIALATGCQSDPQSTVQQTSQQAQSLLQIATFNQDNPLVNVSYSNANGTIANNELSVEFSNKNNTYTDISLEPKTVWDWSHFEDFNLAFDIANKGDRSTQIYLDITDKNGDNYTRSVSIPQGGFKTYYAKMKGHDLATPEGEDGVELNFTSGLRSNPDTWESNEVQFISLWGKKNLDLTSIKKIRISVQHALFNKQIQLKNVRLRANPKMDNKFLTNIVDPYGQNAKQKFDGKVYSDEQLISEKKAERQGFIDNQPEDRSKFGGWASGPKLKATGYFRTEKVDGIWSLVDPEGYIFFSSGIANTRLSNTSTMTGYDFPQAAIAQKKSTDVTPEDSQGLNRAPNSAVPSRFEASATRKDMFTWLPGYDEELSKHYGYRRSAHSGPLKKGETYSFYSANLERKYGGEEGGFMKAWEQTTLDRMTSWGFTSFGNWVDPAFYSNTQVPYFANGWIVGDFKTVSSGNDFWSPMPDVFDPKFEERAMYTARVVADEVKNSPWCVGVFIDNEKSFGRSETLQSQYGIVIHTLKRNGETVPTKAEFTRLMKAKYKNIAHLNKAWEKDLASWEAFNESVDSTINNDAQVADYSILLEAYASKYFSTVHKAVEKYLPNHMYMGARFPGWGMPKEAVKAAAKYADVMSYNSYKEGLHHKKWEFLKDVDMPSIIGEYHVGANDSGLYHPGLIHAANQEDRASMYEDYMNSVIDNPYFIGAHWFQYIDSPLTGRAYDGENYNVGFVTVTDSPYKPLIKSARKINKSIYTRRYK